MPYRLAKREAALKLKAVSSWIETYRKSVRPDLRRIIVAVDPSGTKGDGAGDHVGIIVVGLGLDGAMLTF